ncbi:MAG: DUF362 domain-containing protein [Sedimentisphaerales bacterium]|nr:DUF362 domain-containing protein [Sedimentisphaerales bacterium]
MKHSDKIQTAPDSFNNRRNFLKGGLLMSAGFLLNGQKPTFAAESAGQTTPQKSKVAFTAGKDRREMMNEVLTPFKDMIAEGVKGKKVLIKPNFVSTNNPLCATHVDAVRGVLDFLKPIYNGKITIGESPAGGSSMPGFQNYGYMPLQQEYGVEFADLNTHTTQTLYILDKDLRPQPIQVISDFLDPDTYIISVSRMKTHNTVVATMGLKNIVMGCPLNTGRPSSSKVLMHGASPRWLHYNLFLVAHRVRPNFTVIENLEGMQGDGPISGDPIEHGVSLAGPDVMAVDSICAQLMDIPLENIGYLNYCAEGGLGIIDRAKIDIIGDKKPQEYVKAYKLGSNADTQLKWMQPLQMQDNEGGPFGSNTSGGGGGNRRAGGGGFGGARRGT